VPTAARRRPRTQSPDPDLIEAVLAASRVVVAVASRALAGVAPDVTLPQFRTLVLLDQHGSVSVRELAESLDIAPSTATRMCDRLVAKELMIRGPHPDDRRQVLLTVTPSGRALVARSTQRRRAEFERLLSPLPQRRQIEITRALTAFTNAIQA
jgi:DNA-binding MarR family transcriptional regulator